MSVGCPICAGAMTEVLSLPRFPLTEQFESADVPFRDRGYADQALLFCAGCCHGRLRETLPPETLYGPGYRTATAKSAGAVLAVQHFRDFIERTIDLMLVDCVIDIGANDCTLLDLFFPKRRIGIDPNASGSGDAELMRCFIEDADLSGLKGVRKLIVSSHTLEHIADPAAVIARIAEALEPGDSGAIQVPSLEWLLRDCRIDQVHHQHVQYFSERSLTALLAAAGLQVIGVEFDPSHWGAVMVAFRRGKGYCRGNTIVASEIFACERRFGLQMALLGEQLGHLRGVIGYGAGLMLPVLRYYLPQLDLLDCLHDEDPAKQGLRYTNFDKRITRLESFEGRDVLVTAIGSKQAGRDIMAKLFAANARSVMHPLGMF